MHPDPFHLDLRGRPLNASPGRTHVMGVLNVTPDSFSDGGLYLEADQAVDRAGQMVEEGAAIIDIGGASSRPRGSVYGEGAAAVPPQEEADRVLPVIAGIRRALPEIIISVDTFHGSVARQALAEGAHLINDITGLRHSPEIADLAAGAGAGLALMHSLGQVGQMPHAATYPDVVTEVAAFLKQAADTALAAGVESILLDPGFGFGKSLADNFRLIGHVDMLVAMGFPVLIGVSRKSSIGAALGSKDAPLPVGERLFGSLGATAVGVLRGASVVRTHDVRETRQMLQVLGLCTRS